MTPTTSTSAPRQKIQRWIDLLGALLTRALPASFDDLAREVPEYARKLDEMEREPDSDRRATLRESIKRTWERDKKELREFGVPLESLPDADGNDGGLYRLRRADFYLPYLCFAVPDGGLAKPDRVDRWGYQALTSLTFDADELQAVVDAANAVRSLGDPLLASGADSALRKLAVDLPVGATPPSADEPHLVLPRTRGGAEVYEALSDALSRRKVVRFTYRAMSTDRTEERTVEPYGLFFVSAHWYLAARDQGRGELRNFRLDRITLPAVNTKKEGTPDYEIPATFRLRDHARSRQAWELGDGDALTAIVRFDGSSGPTVAARRLGVAVDGDETCRAFQVRRVDSFVRWVLSFAGELTPLSPTAVVERHDEEVAAVAQIYVREAPVERVAPSPRLPNVVTPSPEWQPKGAAAQLRRILHVVPQIADGEDHPMAEVAERVGASVDVLRRDLYSLVNRYDLPGGFVEGVSLYLESDRVSAHSNHFARPMRLTASELCALDLGLAVLRARRLPDEHGVLERARERLAGVIAQLPGDPIPDVMHGVAADERGNTEHLTVIRTALRERRKVLLLYRKSGSATASERTICPIALLAAHGALYVVAHCDDAEGVRVFRMDRVEAVTLLDEAFEVPSDFSVESVVSDGRVFSAEAAGVMTVRYSARIARWIAEREGLIPEADGSVVVDHPLGDVDWGVRHVLQYGRDAEVVAPVEVRAAITDRLRRLREG